MILAWSFTMKVMEYFLDRYSPEDYLLYARVKLLLIFELVLFVGVFFLQFSMLFAGWEDFAGLRVPPRTLRHPRAHPRRRGAEHRGKPGSGSA